MNNIRFEAVQDVHLPEIMDIYGHYVLNTISTFHTQEPSRQEMRELVYISHPRYQTFVIFDNNQICGYIILGQYKKREAYDGTAEVSVYLRPGSIGRGIGSLAVQYMEGYAAAKGLHVLVATICGENSKSISLFERNGFTKCAHYKEAGKKFGRYLDVVVYQKIIE